METPCDLHLCINSNPKNTASPMKAMVTLLFVMIANVCIGQSRSLLNKLAMELAEQLEDGRLRGKTERLQFFKDSMGIKIEWSRLDSLHKEKSRKVLANYADSLAPIKRYQATIYFDEYSNQIYPTAYIRPTFNGFPNRDNYSAYPRIKGGMVNFVKSVYRDLRKHKSVIDTLDSSEWASPINILIEPTREHALVNERALTRLLDSSLAIKWQPATYYAMPVRSEVSISVKRRLVLSKNEVDNYIDYVRDVSIDHVLMEKYKDKLVRYKSDQPKPSGNPLVSFVFNPISERLENPIIHYGDIGEAETFITWLEKLTFPTNVFYWPGFPEAKRTYFYIGW